MTGPILSPAQLTVSCQVNGCPVQVRVPDDSDRRAVRAILSGFAAVTTANGEPRTYAVVRDGSGRWQIHAGSVCTHEAMTLDAALLALEWQLVTDLLSTAGHQFHLHGSALADPTGTFSVLVLGDSGVGKTTLTLALMAHGFAPFTDDVVLIDPEALTPGTFERAFHVDQRTRTLLEDLPHPTGWDTPGVPDGYFVPARWAREPAPVRTIVFPRGQGLERPLLVGLSIPEATSSLLAFSGTLEPTPELALRTAARLTASAASYALYAGPLPMTAEFLVSVVGRPDRAAG